MLVSNIYLFETYHSNDFFGNFRELIYFTFDDNHANIRLPNVVSDT